MDKIIFKGCRENPETGSTSVWVSYHGEISLGTSQVAEEDQYSPIYGGRLAEARAILKAYQKERVKRKKEYKTLKDFVTQIKSYKTYKPCPALETALNKKAYGIKKMDRRIEAQEKVIQNIIKERSSYTDFLERRKRLNELRAKLKNNLKRKNK